MANPSMALFLLLTLAIGTGKLYQFAEGGGKRRIHITDDLDDVVDDEEDDSWREWGKTKSTTPDFDPPPEDFSNLDPSKMQEELLKRQFGSVFGFVKLRLLGSPRTSVSIAIQFVSLFGSVLEKMDFLVLLWCSVAGYCIRNCYKVDQNCKNRRHSG